MVIPAAQSPFKSGENLIPKELRWKMLEIALPKHPRLQLLDIEINRSGLSYSYQTWQQLCEQYRLKNWFWVVGSDTFAKFDRWCEAADFIQNIQLLIINRKEADWNFSEFWNPLIRLFQATTNSRDEREFWLNGKRIAICLDFDIPAISSSQIRSGKVFTEWIVPGTRIILQSALDEMRGD
jgi:nicotinate-nucleotide adenylyltransferase